MKSKLNWIIGLSAWTVIVLIVTSSLISACSSNKKKIEERVLDEGLLRNDDLVAVKTSDGKVSIKNETTGKVTIKDIKIDWTQESTRDSLAVFCSEKKRGFYNMYTGEITIPARYRRAWIFSEGLAAVQRNGMIGFINHKGETVIDFKYPYHGNPLSSFVFSDGKCIVADTLGKCGMIDKKGNWIIKPEYDNISAFKEYTIVSSDGIRRQITYDGKEINSFVLDYVSPLTFTEHERYENREGELKYITKTIKTGLYCYRVGGRCGLMDAHGKRLTKPLYSSIQAEDKNMFRATLFDNYSEVILNAKGEVMQ